MGTAVSLIPKCRDYAFYRFDDQFQSDEL